jgi:hypothetical protein
MNEIERLGPKHLRLGPIPARVTRATEPANVEPVLRVIRGMGGLDLPSGAAFLAGIWPNQIATLDRTPNSMASTLQHPGSIQIVPAPTSGTCRFTGSAPLLIGRVPLSISSRHVFTSSSISGRSCRLDLLSVCGSVNVDSEAVTHFAVRSVAVGTVGPTMKLRRRLRLSTTRTGSRRLFVHQIAPGAVLPDGDRHRGGFLMGLYHVDD